jgi:hypothetical protein
MADVNTDRDRIDRLFNSPDTRRFLFHLDDNPRRRRNGDVSPSSGRPHSVVAHVSPTISRLPRSVSLRGRASKLGGSPLDRLRVAVTLSDSMTYMHAVVSIAAVDASSIQRSDSETCEQGVGRHPLRFIHVSVMWI